MKEEEQIEVLWQVMGDRSSRDPFSCSSWKMQVYVSRAISAKQNT